MDLKISIEIIGIEKEIALICLDGEVTFKTALLPRKRIKKIMEKGIFNFCIDLKGITYIDSAGLGLIVSLKIFILRQGGDLVLLSPSLFVKNLIFQAGLKDYLTICENINDVQRRKWSPKNKN